MNDEITVILNGYLRPEYLSEQIDAINNQTIKPKEIMCWQNNSSKSNHPNFSLFDNFKTAKCNKNLGVWSRFAYALMATTKYICIFDDDTIPGRKWLENCLNTIKTYRGLLGTIGLVYDDETSYYKLKRYGWDSSQTNNIETIRVDIVGHCWFFEREMLTAFWRELPDPKWTQAGEDIHFSHMIQKYMKLNTYVPPHPPNDRELWGSLKAIQYGGDENNTATKGIGPGHGESTPERSCNIHLMNEYYLECIANGFEIINKK